MPDQPRPALVLAAHGTASATGRRSIEDLTTAVAALLPGAHVRLGYVDVCGPTLHEALDGLGSAVVVPLFLTRGYHVGVDIPAAVAAAAGRAARDIRIVVTEAIGCTAGLVAALVDQVRSAGGDGPSRVVLAAAGSSREGARADAAAVAANLAEALNRPVRLGFLSGPGPQVAAVMTEATSAEGSAGQVVVAALLLAPGVFADRLQQLADAHRARVTPPLAGHPLVADAVVGLYRDALPTVAPSAPPHTGGPARSGSH